MTNIDIAKDLIMSFTNGDTGVADEFLADNFVEHGCNTDREGFKDAVLKFDSYPELTKVDILRTFEDGDYVVLHSMYNIGGKSKKVVFNIFKFKDGKATDHWTAYDDINNLSTPAYGETKISDTNKTAENKKLVEAFVDDVLYKKNSAQGYMHSNLKIEGKMVYGKKDFVLGQGNFVLTVNEGAYDGKPAKCYDLFRVENGKIAEHWDVISLITACKTK